jgi:hypothetical protein
MCAVYDGTVQLIILLIQMCLHIIQTGGLQACLENKK